MPGRVTCDGSAFVGAWPFISTPDLSLPELVERYRQLDVVRGAVTPLAAILSPEPMTANMAFLWQARALPEDGTSVIAVPVINPTLSSCSQDLELCCATGARAFKIFPAYHGYPLHDERVRALARQCQHRRMPLCIQVRMEDERSQNPVFQVPAVDVRAVAVFAQDHPELSILVCGLYMAELPELAACGNVAVDLSFVEAGMLLASAMRALPAERLMLGTHAPLFVADAGIAKVRSEPIPSAASEALCTGTFSHVFGPGPVKDGSG